MDPLSQPPEDPNKLQQEIMDGIITLKHQHRSLNVKGAIVRIPEDGDIVIVGDIHGDFNSLKRIIEKTNIIDRMEKSDSQYLVFLGDYIDRGSQQIEVLHTVLRLLNEHPNQVFPLRGNHEGPRDLRASPHDFPQHLRYHYGESGIKLYNSFQQLFENFYVAAYINEKALLVHGGIPTSASSLDELAEAPRTHPSEPHLTEILWNDPSSIPGILPNPRGAGKQFGNDVANKFLDDIGARLLIRGHQSAEEGYRIQGRIITLFSCKLPHYGNENAAYLDVDLNKPLNQDTVSWFIETF
ncbi:MAG: metallophosphoesterase [Candidatus Bathyarchaeia archaeon]